MVSIIECFNAVNAGMSSLKPDACMSDSVPHGHKNPLWMGLARRLSDARCAINAAGEHVSRAAGLGPSTSNQIEDERRIPRVGTVEQLAVALGVPPAWLAFGHEGTLRFRERRPRSPLPPDFPEVSLAERPFPNAHRGLAERLRAARELKGLSIRRVASDAGLSHQGIVNIESGASEARISAIEAIAKVLDVAPGWLAFGDGEGPDSRTAI